MTINFPDYIGYAHTHPEINFRANSSSRFKPTETIKKLTFSVLLRGLSLSAREFIPWRAWT
jgi:hypothetical protein